MPTRRCEKSHSPQSNHSACCLDDYSPTTGLSTNTASQTMGQGSSTNTISTRSLRSHHVLQRYFSDSGTSTTPLLRSASQSRGEATGVGTGIDNVVVSKGGEQNSVSVAQPNDRPDLVPHRPRQVSNVVLPVMQCGEKLSDTHYWLMPRRRGRSIMSYPPATVGYNTGSSGRSTSSRGGRTAAMYVNLRSCRSIPQACLPVPAPAAVVRSATVTCAAVPASAVCDVLTAFPRATEQEAYTALVASAMNAADAVRYLKVELLFRTGYHDRASCHALLQQNHWDFELCLGKLKLRPR